MHRAGHRPNQIRQTRLGVVLAACFVATLATGCGIKSEPTTSPVGPHLITPAAARQVVTAYDTANNNVIKSASVTANDRIEEGFLSQVDDARASTNAPDLSLPATDPFSFSKIAVMVPHQTTFPAYFIATETATSATTSPQTWLLLFEQDTKTAPWRASFWVGLISDTQLDFAVGHDGYGEVGAGQSLPLSSAPTEIASDYAALSDAMTTTATPPLGIFAANVATSGSAQQVYQATPGMAVRASRVHSTARRSGSRSPSPLGAAGRWSWGCVQTQAPGGGR